VAILDRLKKLFGGPSEGVPSLFAPAPAEAQPASAEAQPVPPEIHPVPAEEEWFAAAPVAPVDLPSLPLHLPPRSSPVATFEQDHELRYTALNAPAAWLTADAVLGSTDADFLGPDEAARVMELKRGVLESGANAREEVRVTIDGQIAYFDVALEPRWGADDQIIGLAGVMMDVTARKRAEETILRVNDDLEAQMRAVGLDLDRAKTALEAERAARQRAEEEVVNLSDQDSLTGLPNRRLFNDRLAMGVVQAHRQKQKLAVVVLGLDGFRKLTERLGRKNGDDLLRSVSEVLQQSLRQGDTIARVGGDEFTIILPGIKRDEDVAKVAEKLRLSLRSPFAIGGQTFIVSASMGVALYPDDGPDSETLLKSAAVAMRRAKEQGGDTFDIHAPKTSAAATEHLAFESALRKALVNNELALYYQAILDSDSGAIVAVEGLLRWRNPDKRLLAAQDFMPLADTTSLAVPLGQWALRTACTQASAWQKAGYTGLGVSVNLSGRQLLHPALTRLVSRVLGETKLPPSSLDLEVSEADLLANADRCIERLRELKALGVMLSIDDYGAGQSVLSQLHRYPVDALKIDRSVIGSITTDRNQEAVASAAIALARTRKLHVVAEGVETEEQRILLELWQCDRMQGNLCGVPLPSGEMEKVLARQWSAGREGTAAKTRTS
jgi:diguanylate cyclase (GGDEF)-like protein/PAS domain S-box-containing protein